MGRRFDIAKIAKLDDAGRAETLDPEMMWMALERPDARTMVEIGAGTGFFARRFCHFIEGAVVYACDVEDAMLEWMRERVPEVRTGKVVPVKSSETHVPLHDAVADLVYMINLHHELGDPEAAYAEAFRLTRPGGQVMAVDWRPVDTPKGPPLAVRASAEEIGHALCEAGYRDIAAFDVLPWHNMVVGWRSGGR